METDLLAQGVQQHVAASIESALNPGHVSVVDLPMGSAKTSIVRTTVCANRMFPGKQKIVLYIVPNKALAIEQSKSFWLKEIKCTTFGHSGSMRGLDPDDQVEIVIACAETIDTDRFRRWLQVNITTHQIQQPPEKS
jgi:replicative superfamily II helicase